MVVEVLLWRLLVLEMAFHNVEYGAVVELVPSGLGLVSAVLQVVPQYLLISVLSSDNRFLCCVC